MAFKELNDLSADNVIALGGQNRKTGKKNPTSVEGFYLGSKKVESKKSKSGFAYIHILQTPQGNIGVWGKTDLDRKILTAVPGTMVRATHVGMQETPNGEMYKFKVEVDPDNTIEVNLSTAAQSFNDEDEESLNEATSEDEESGYEEARIPVAASANQARVKELLSRSKKLS